MSPLLYLYLLALARSVKFNPPRARRLRRVHLHWTARRAHPGDQNILEVRMVTRTQPSNFLYVDCGTLRMPIESLW